MVPSQTERIAALNDAFRRTFLGGQVLLTRGIADLPEAHRTAIIARVQAFSDFSEDNDPYREHDFGAFDYDGHNILWKIDYYDRAMEYGSPDPADPKKTSRVLTILLSEEW